NVAGCRGPVVVHVVQHLAHPPVELAAWPDADRASRLVFITRGISEKQVRDLLASVRALVVDSGQARRRVPVLLAREPPPQQSCVRLFPMPAPSTTLAPLEQFASPATNTGRCVVTRRSQLAASQGRHAPMARMTLDVNGKVQTIDADPDMPLLYALRNELSLNNPHFGCGLAQCGACTVPLDGPT